MTISIFMLALMLLIAFAAGWVVRSFVVRMYPKETAKFDSTAGAVGDRASTAYGDVRDRINKP